MTCAEARLALGAYVLGTLDRAERDAVSIHLQQCARCRAEHAELSALPPLLEQVALPGPDLLPALAARVLRAREAERALERARARGRRRVAALAAAAALAVVPASAAYVVGRATADGAASPGGATAGGGAPVATAPTGRMLTGWDSATKVSAQLRVAAKGWGTEIEAKVSGVSGGKTCQLVAVTRDGRRVVAGSWWVPKKDGDGAPTGTRTEIGVTGAVALKASEIAWFEVETLDGERLVGVPT